MVTVIVQFSGSFVVVIDCIDSDIEYCFWFVLRFQVF